MSLIKRPIIQISEQIQLIDFEPAVGKIEDELVESLAEEPKRISPKFFYNEKGSQIFEDICELPEYYLTRTEISILRNNQELLQDFIGDLCNLVEFGSGSSKKIRYLLAGKEEQIEYVPIEISRDFLIQSVKSLNTEFPDMHITAICADYTMSIKLILNEAYGKERTRRNVVFFPGSTLGNFRPEEAEQFLAHICDGLESGDGMIIGMDVHKETERLEAAYNDSQNVTAAFNLNMLSHLNKEAGTDFEVDNFAHKSFFNEEKYRIEMHLESLKEQTVKLNGHSFAIDKGELIHTENSYKLPVAGLYELFASAGFEVAHELADDSKLFRVFCLTKP